MGRESTVVEWLVLFAATDLEGFTLKINDRIDVLASDGTTVVQSVFVNGSFDAASRGSVLEVPCREIL